MKLEKLRQSKDKYLIPYVFKQIELIKDILKIPKNSRVYFLGCQGEANLFLHKNKVIVSFWKTEKDEKNNRIIDTLTITNLYTITLLKEYPKTDDDIVFEKIKTTNDEYEKYTDIHFLYWIDMPSRITEDVDLRYFEVIKFLQKYNKYTFKTDDYLFYSKKDDEFCYTLNLYMKDLKNNAELKLYIPQKTVQKDDENWVIIPPQNLRDFVAVDLSGKLSQHKITKAKKAFLKYANEYSHELKTQNFFALEFIKQTIQPVEYVCGWPVCRVMNLPVSNIWVFDFMKKGEEPYFIITDSPFSQEAISVAVINIKNAKYHNNDEIYKAGLVKFKTMKLNKISIQKLMAYFNSPATPDKFQDCELYRKYVKTTWQALIYTYNHNSAEWGWDKDDSPPGGITEYGIEQVPFDTPMPNYMELLEEK